MHIMKWLSEHTEIISIGVKEHCCVNCRHFHLHYIKNDRTERYTPLCCGHCSFPRIKDRRVYNRCEHFAQRCEE